MGEELLSSFKALPNPPRRVLGATWQGFGVIHWLMFALIPILLGFAFYFLLLLCVSATGDPLAMWTLVPWIASLAGVAALMIVLHRAYRHIRLTQWLCRAGIAVAGEVVAKRRGGPRRNIGIVRYRFVDPRNGKTVELEAEPPRRLWAALTPGHPINVLVDPRRTSAVVVYELQRFTVAPIPMSGIAGDTLGYHTPPPPYGPRVFKYAVIAMLASTVLPVWTYWSVGSWEATGGVHIFWVAIVAFPIHHPRFMRDVITEYLAIFSISALLGAGFAALRVGLDRRAIRAQESDEM